VCELAAHAAVAEGELRRSPPATNVGLTLANVRERRCTLWRMTSAWAASGRGLGCDVTRWAACVGSVSHLCMSACLIHALVCTAALIPHK
jgi:hypothetical protein